MISNNQHSPDNLSLLSRFSNHLKEKRFWNERDKLFLACSGGIDSMVLAHLLQAIGCKFEILHCNFNLRGDESARDEKFIRTYAEKSGLPIRLVSFDTKQFMKQWGLGIQETARKLRYDWFREIINSEATNKVGVFVITAHHADDVAETMLINFLRGTGIAGLHGIPEKNEKFLRPLLFATRKDISAYAEHYDIEWVEDSSNSESSYTRNLIRNKILAEIEMIFPSVKENLVANAKRLAETELLYRMQIEKICLSLTKELNGQIAVPVELLRKTLSLDTVMHELFTPYGFSSAQVDEIKKLFDAPTGKWLSSHSHRVLKNRNWLLIEKLEEYNFSIHIISQEMTEIVTPTFKLNFTEIERPDKIDGDPSKAWIDARFIRYPLILRRWKEGDYFYPLGMNKKKKVARFMTDLKLNRFEKENQWVLLSENKIIWVLGKRIDERCKVVPGTERTLLVTMHSKDMIQERAH